MKSLTLRAQSIAEIRRKLRQRAEHPQDVEQVIGRLHEYGYLNDRRFAESYAGARLENQILGKSRVLRDLRERRVSPELAEKTVAQVYREVDEMELIEKFLQRKVRTNIPLADALEDPKQLASIYRKLLRAGFTPSNAIQALKRTAPRQETLEAFEPSEETEEE